MKLNKTMGILGLISLVLLNACAPAPTAPELKKSGSSAAVEQPAASQTPAKSSNQEPAKTTAAQTVDLQAEALAILNKSCVSCHSASNMQGNFGNLDNVEAMLASGRYLVAGSPEKS